MPLLHALSTYLHQWRGRDRRWYRPPRSVQTNLQSGVGGSACVGAGLRCAAAGAAQLWLERMGRDVCEALQTVGMSSRGPCGYHPRRAHEELTHTGGRGGTQVVAA
jgi:hypothetical protein